MTTLAAWELVALVACVLWLLWYGLGFALDFVGWLLAADSREDSHPARERDG